MPDASSNRPRQSSDTAPSLHPSPTAYDFSIGDVMREAWALTAGFKRTFWIAAAVIYTLAVAVSGVCTRISAALVSDELGAQLVGGVLANALSFPLALGLMMMPVQRAAGRETSFRTAFGYFDLFPEAVIAGVLTALACYLGFLLFLVPGLYLSVAYAMTLPLIGERGLKAWDAMEASRRALSPCWFKVFGLYLLVGTVVVVSALPFGVGLIWTAPWCMLVVGVLYRRVFDASGAPKVSERSPENPDGKPARAQSPSASELSRPM